MVILHSTTCPYGRPMIEVAYGEILFSLYRDCMGDVSSGRVVGVSTCFRPCWTYPDQHQCGLNVYYFLDFFFKNIKTYMYYVFKSIHVYSIIQKHWWSLILSWPDGVQRTFSTAHWFWRNKVSTTDDFSWVLKECYDIFYHSDF